MNRARHGDEYVSTLEGNEKGTNNINVARPRYTLCPDSTSVHTLSLQGLGQALKERRAKFAVLGVVHCPTEISVTT